MKKAIAVFPIIFVVLFKITVFSTEAVDTTSKASYEIQFEKLSDAEDANEFNYNRSTLLSYINNKIKHENKVSNLNLDYLKKSDLNFNDDNAVRGIKVYDSYTDYSVNSSYDSVMAALADSHYSWHILIKTEKTAVYLIISPNSIASDNKSCFEDKWVIDCCDVSKSTGSMGSSTVSAANSYAMFDGAEANINKFVKHKKTDDIKVVYTNLGNTEMDYHFFSRCGIVFVNGTAKYIYALGFEIYPDNLTDNTPESIRNLLNDSLSDLYNNRVTSIWGCKDIKQLYDYDYIMSLIIVYEEYALI